MKKIRDYYKKAKNQYGYSKKMICIYVLNKADIEGLDRRESEKELNKILKEDEILK